MLLTLPISKIEIILGKFLAAWLFAALALILTFPLWISVNYLGDTDNGVIFARYICSWLMAGGCLSIGSCMSALTRSQVVAFVLCGFITLLFVMAGFPLVLDVLRGWVPLLILDAITSLSFLTHYNSITKGVLSLNDFLYFISIIVAWLFATAIAIESKKS